MDTALMTWPEDNTGDVKDVVVIDYVKIWHLRDIVNTKDGNGHMDVPLEKEM